MKKQLILFTFLLTVFGFSGIAQDKSSRPSPPAQTKATIDGVEITIDYSQPALKGRDFGGADFHPYGNVWRTGANEATWIETSADLMINGKKLPKGKYGFFTIPEKEEWTLIFNSVWDQWGAYNYDNSKDVLRVKAKASSGNTAVERFTISLDNSGKGSLMWGETKVDFTITKS